jgi:SecD/SecF fusion protein
MAVDANVLIYDRIREELATGKAVRTAIADGYKGSRSAIIDANVTTLLTAIILFVFGTGPIRGFATTLIIGIASSLFTAIFITRLYFEWRLKRSEEMSFATSITKNWFTNTNFQFMSLRKPAYIFSALMILVSLGSLMTRGLSLGVDFEGGRTYQVRFDQPVEVAAVADALGAQWVGEDGRAYAPAVKTLGSPDQVVITTNYRVDDNGADVEEALQASLYEGVKGFYAAPVSLENFVSPSSEEAVGLVASRQVGPTVADDIKDTAVWAIIFSLIAIFLYLLLRFSKWQYSLGAVAATVHDTIIVLGAFSLLDGVLPFSMEVDQAFIAAILTVIGYSLNDTVVVFDRIREFFGESTKQDMKSDVLDNALNATLSRTFNTSFTTIIVLLIIFIFGGEVLRGFIFAILLGIVIGTYSSLFIASPVLYDSSKRLGKEKA